MRILIADDQELAREGLKALLRRAEDMEIVGEARGGREAITLTQQLSPDVVLMDIGLPEMDGLQATHELLEGRPNTHVLIITQYVDDVLLKIAIRRGAKGFVSKSEMAGELIPALRALVKGSEYYSSSVSKLIAEWNKNKEEVKSG